jgi:nitroreductase
MSIRWERPGMNTNDKSTFVFDPAMNTTINQLNPAILNRHSFRTFKKDSLSEEQIALIFEAARLAPSSMNAQAWEYVYATPENQDAFDKVLSCLNPSNQVWAKNAPLLIICSASKNYENGNPYKHAWHDAGMANSQLIIQAVSMGLFAHVMGGIDYQATRERLNIPDSHDILCCIAIGYQGDGSDLETESLRLREAEISTRKPLSMVARKA